MNGHVDVLFANEREILSLYETDDFDDALAPRARGMRGRASRAASAARSSLARRGARISAMPVERVVDTTGAGDLYAAGFLYGSRTAATWRRAAGIGGICAAEVISHFGARPETPLVQLIAGI